MSKIWSDEELKASVVAYIDMMNKDALGVPYVKSEYYAELGKKFGRTPKSFAYRMHNISHIFSDMGRKWISGLKPASNVGSNHTDTIKRLIAEIEQQSSLETGGQVKSQGAAANQAVIKKTSIPRLPMPNFTRLPKPFLLLAGISGTGKTRFVRQQAQNYGEVSKSYCLVPVRPDWHEPSDILGYVSRLNQSAEFVVTDVLRFLASAWRELFEQGFGLQVEQSDVHGERIVVNGERPALDAVRPFWLCLDEMNLAPVEQYFADYLAVIETRSWQWQDDDFSYFCEPLLKPALIAQVDDKDKLRCDLGFDGAEYDESWQRICEYGLSIPFNLIVAGTVNMDETTHGFSRKVIDRALSLDFGEFFPNDFDVVFEPQHENKALSFPVLSDANRADMPAIDPDGTKSIAFLKAINEILKQTPFELAYRALNELLLAVITQNPKKELELKAVWDDFMMYKVLPRIEGDADKLAQQNIEQSLLVKLRQLLAKQFASFWDAKERPDLMRQRLNDDNKTILVQSRSNVKLQQMQTQLVNCGFTSFWP